MLFNVQTVLLSYCLIFRPMLRAHVGEVDKLIDEIEDTVEDAVHTMKQKVEP